MEVKWKMNSTEIVGFVGFLLGLAAKYFVGKKYRWGWWFFILSGVAWTIGGILSSYWMLTFTSFIYAAMDSWNCYKWYKEDK